jgi:hypothetical protein
VGRVTFKRRVTPLDGNHVFALSSCIAPFHLPSPRMGSARVAFVLSSLEERNFAECWYLSAIARLQGFSSDSPAASPRRWSPKTVTTSSMVGRSKPGCGLCPALSFKDLHHPCWGGGRAEPELYLPHGLVGHLLLQHSGEKALTGLAEGADSTTRGRAAASVVSSSMPGSLAQLALARHPMPPPTARRSAAICPPYGRPLCCAHQGTAQDVARC